ncbi:putative xylanase 3 [Fusarium acuminatum]
MSVGSAAYMQIQWIDMVYNATKGNEDKRGLDGQMLEGDVGQKKGLARRDDGEDECKVVCSIDDVDKAGKTKVLWKSAASKMTEMGYWTGTVVIGLTIMMLCV